MGTTEATSIDYSCLARELVYADASFAAVRPDRKPDGSPRYDPGSVIEALDSDYAVFAPMLSLYVGAASSLFGRAGEDGDRTLWTHALTTWMSMRFPVGQAYLEVPVLYRGSGLAWVDPQWRDVTPALGEWVLVEAVNDAVPALKFGGSVNPLGADWIHWARRAIGQPLDAMSLEQLHAMKSRA